MEEESIDNDQVCDLIHTYWDELNLDEKKQIEIANNSMKFFLKHEAFDRIEYEYNIMKKVFKLRGL
jgi:hypothetical protein